MLRKTPRLLFIAPILFLPFVSFGQTAADTASANTGKTAAPPQATARNGAKPWLFPGVLILYGALTPHLDALTDLNEDTHDAVWGHAKGPRTSADSYLQFAPTAALAALNLAGIPGRHDRVDQALLVLLSQTIMGASVYTVKTITHVRRPDGSGYNSFPSGHTAEAFASAELLREEYGFRSPWYGIGGYAVAATVGYLRLYNNKHWLNDVIGGAGFGIASTRLACLLLPRVSGIVPGRWHKHFAAMPYYNGESAGFNLALPL